MVEGLTVGGSTPGRIRSGFLGWTCRPGMAGRLDRQAQLEASADLLASVQALRSNP
jgi:hypothetical protein